MQRNSWNVCFFVVITFQRLCGRYEVETRGSTWFLEIEIDLINPAGIHGPGRAWMLATNCDPSRNILVCPRGERCLVFQRGPVCYLCSGYWWRTVVEDSIQYTILTESSSPNFMFPPITLLLWKIWFIRQYVYIPHLANAHNSQHIKIAEISYCIIETWLGIMELI